MVHTFAVTQKELLRCPGTNTESRRISNWGKQAEGLKGISTNPGQVVIWIESIGVCSHLARAMDEQGGNMWELERDDRLRTLTKQRKHSQPLTHQSESQYNIVNGQVVAETKS